MKLSVKIFLFLLLGVIIIILTYKHEQDSFNKLNKSLNNNLFLTGEVKKIKISDNHNFGILYIKVKDCNLDKFVQTLSRGIYPYKIVGDNAELYTTIPDGIKVGDKIKIDSNNKLVFYYYLNSKKEFKSSISIILDSIDIDFVKSNSELE